jgi:hypothetical protein
MKVCYYLLLFESIEHTFISFARFICQPLLVMSLLRWFKLSLLLWSFAILFDNHNLMKIPWIKLMLLLLTFIMSVRSSKKQDCEMTLLYHVSTLSPTIIVKVQLDLVLNVSKSGSAMRD